MKRRRRALPDQKEYETDYRFIKENLLQDVTYTEYFLTDSPDESVVIIPVRMTKKTMGRFYLHFLGDELLTGFATEGNRLKTAWDKYASKHGPFKLDASGERWDVRKVLLFIFEYFRKQKRFHNYFTRPTNL